MEKFKIGDNVIVVKGYNVPISTIGKIIQIDKPIYVNAHKYYIKVVIISNKKYYTTYIDNIEIYEFEKPYISNTLVYDEQYLIYDEII